MKILVCISHVPDTTSKINFTNNDTEFDKNGVQFVINPNDEFGLTKAVQMKEQQGATITVVNVGELYSDVGYNSYFDNGYARVDYEDYDGTYKSKKVRGFIVTRRSDLVVPTNVTGISGSFYEEDILTDVFTQELILQEGSQTASLASDLNIISIATASGYLKSHYIYNKDRSVGLENTFFKGSKQTSATTIDGRAAIEEFISNPTILRVNENGRPNNEPILVVD